MAKPALPMTSKPGKSSTSAFVSGPPISADDAQAHDRDVGIHR
ncbi:MULTISPECIES: hypothetical protein [Agrobacterium]|uniref:Uncharacterized protein n=1 Tax=Agrobacterium rosae TaxID=1972867 RepID=A0A1R3TXI7_9HYPH|nr:MULTISPECIES: hypothetical protein [Agrobacterium]SCX31553.1 hypothetical protein DSM25559_3742 [Agrobacterium rosae]